MRVQQRRENHWLQAVSELGDRAWRARSAANPDFPCGGVNVTRTTTITTTCTFDRAESLESGEEEESGRETKQLLQARAGGRSI